jgi:hypothetical protein
MIWKYDVGVGYLSIVRLPSAGWRIRRGKEKLQPLEKGCLF